MTQKIALVTGASRGIGKAIALKLAKDGFYVICISRSNTSQETAKEIEENKGHAEAFSIDVSDLNAVCKLAKAVLEKHKKVDVLVNNAGITRDNLTLRMSYEDWDEVIKTNLYSCFYWSKELLRSMIHNRAGRIINISSVSSLLGTVGQANYSASKAGVIGLTKSMAREVASRNITVNAIAPGFIETDMTKDLNTEAIDKSIPLRRQGKPEEIASLVSYLASPEAGYITGSTFAVDGGLTMH